MQRFIFLFIIFLCLCTYAQAQYAPQAGLKGSDAISASSGIFAGWATGCSVQRGYMNIADTALGYASLGDSSQAIGMANDNVVSLGDSGVAILTFANPIYNGPGADFAIFENGFRNPSDSSLAFLELGFVEVSSDGINYFRFPATSLTQDTVQVKNADYLNAASIHNLAGSFIALYGTPFDLEELSGVSGLDINNITHVRIVDVIGSINGHSTYDSAGRIVNDPYPTPYPSCGFDLDAVGVIHQKTTSVNSLSARNAISIYPNPAVDRVFISFNGNETGRVYAVITDVAGKIIQRKTLSKNNDTILLTAYSSGVYFIQLHDEAGNIWSGKIMKL